MKRRPDTEAEASEPWEALDLDDSDLSSFIRRCNHSNPSAHALPIPKRTSSSTNPSSVPLLLRVCSQSSSESPPLESCPQPLETFASRLIPGPAGAVQAAMLRKLDNDPSAFGVEGEPIPTQDYIRRAIEKPGGDDEDFFGDPWISAVQFVRNQGMLGDDGVAIGTPFSSIKKGYATGGKVNQVVGILESCTPNGLGDIMATLKDPTGTIDASIHRKVLSDHDFAKDIGVGAVLILRKVTVFCTSSSSRCINVTLKNIFKIITKDNLSSKEKQDCVAAAKTTAHSFDLREDGEESWMQLSAFSLERQAGRRMENLWKNAHIKTKVRPETCVEGDSSSGRKSHCSDVEAGEQRVHPRPQAEGAEANLVDESCQDSVNVSINIRANRKPESISEQAEDSTEEVLAVQPPNEDSADPRRKEPLLSCGYLPEWTDEQLDELFD